MIYYVSAEAARPGDGSATRPFQTINEAARIAQAGDTVLVGPGVYRENVNPVHPGTKEQPVIYRSTEPLGAVISGAEKVSRWSHYQGDVWLARIPNGVFGSQNPYTEEIFGDWYYATRAVHTGDVYLNGKAMYERLSLEEVLEPEVNPASWDPAFTVYTWYTCQSDGFTLIYANFQGLDPNGENTEINVRKNCFWPKETGVDYITVSGFTIRQAATNWAPPTAYQEGMIGPNWSKGWVIEDCEISDSRCCGISLGKYYQPENDNKWSIKRLKQGTQTERDAICQAQVEGWTKERIGSHIVRRCNIHDCGQTGIVGHLGGVFSIIENNHIHHINNRQDLAGAEIGGIKMHAAIDTVIRGNHIHHCTRGLWLDWQAQGTRVSGNLFHDNMPPAGTRVGNSLAVGQDIFVEVSHGPTLIDNNLLLSSFSCKLAAQGVAFVHNMICGAFTSVGEGTDNTGTGHERYTPYHFKHRTEVAGFMTFLHGDDRFYNNLFIRTRGRKQDEDSLVMLDEWVDPQLPVGTAPFDEYPTVEEYLEKFFDKKDTGAAEDRNKYYDKLPVMTGGNLYYNGALPCRKERNYRTDTEHEIYVRLVSAGGQYRLETNVYDYIPEIETGMISTELLGEAFEPEQRFENPDGSEIIFNRDYFGAAREMNPLPGPFATGDDSRKALW